MNDNMTLNLLAKLIELKHKFDSPTKTLTFKVTGVFSVVVSVNPCREGILCHVDLHTLTEEKIEEVVEIVTNEFAG